MVKERAQRKSFQQSLEDIKEKMKEKRNIRLDRASAPSRGRSRMIHKSSGTNSTHTILKGVQLNNKALAVALQSEKEKMRQANAVILQLKREQQALFLHLLLLKRKLKEQEALTAMTSESKPTNVPVEPQHAVTSARRKRTNQNLDERIVCKASPISAEPQTSVPPECDRQVTLPSTVGVRRRHADRRSRRRSERVREQRSLSEGGPIAGLETLIASPIHGDDKNPNPLQPESELADLVDAEEFQHSTPERASPKKRNQQQANRKQAQQQTRTKPEPAARKAERGRRPERAQLKKPWENPKPRARSKSRDRSATRSKAAPPPQGNKLNTSLGFNDTFDFDCEETVHITPFRTKAEDNQPATPVSEEAPQRGQAQTGASSVASGHNELSSSSPSSESEDSLYVPQKNRKRQTSPDNNRAITTRRGRPSKVARQKENIPPEPEISVFRDEESSPEHAEKEANLKLNCADSSFSNSPDPVGVGLENHPEPLGEVMEEDCLLPVSPLVEAEMMRIGNVLSNFGDSSCDAPPLVPHQTPQRIRTCKKRGLGKRTAGRGLSLCDVTNLSPAAYRKFSSDARCSTPVPARKRRCTMVVDYKEPSLNAKLRRGDKFTDLQFLQSPIFKQKSDRRSVQKPRNSLSGKQPFEKYNESFVGCR
ncbi:shugoshin 1 [Scophthalmus maximus]|uniref:shugoshin 1 n=1 Tax=Scophthalmus maximus TaxID=52904 RepID=UPI001FA81CFF|nr:shugoshin 1 [Scophthalmus maximus]XP_047186156.1 shugoshin 1 [Scophthalmus maximus]